MSSNIVGYQKMSFTTGYAIFGVQFEEVGGEPKTLQDLFNTANNSLPGITAEAAFQTEIRLWRDNTYKHYGWVADGQGTSILEDSDYDAKWVDTDTWEIIENLELAPSEAGWLMVVSSGDATVSGQVPEIVYADSATSPAASNGNSEPYSIPLSAGFVMLANPVPQQITLAKIVPDASVAGITADATFQTEIRLWRDNTYKHYGWVADGQGTSILEDSDYDAKWVDTDTWTISSDVTVSIGEGFWVKTSASGGSLSFAK